MLKQLAKIADLMDQQGLSVQADEVDRIISMAANKVVLDENKDRREIDIIGLYNAVRELKKTEVEDILKAANLILTTEQISTFRATLSLIVGKISDLKDREKLRNDAPPGQGNFPAALNTFDLDASYKMDDTSVMDIKPITPTPVPTHWDDPNVPVPSIPSDLWKKLREDNDWEEDEED